MGGIIWGLVLVAVAAVLVAVLMSRSPFRRLGIDESLMPIAVSVTQRIRLRNLLAVVAATLVAIATVTYSLSPANGLGEPLFAAPLLTSATGIVFFSIVPTFRETSSRRTAGLARRTVLTFGKLRWFVLAAALAAMLVLTGVGLGLVADGNGRRLDRTGESFMISSGPFPGFFYTVPALAALGLLIAVVVLAIVRMSRAPQPGEESLRAADRALRELAVGVVLRAAAAGTSATLAGLLIPAGTVSASLGHAENWGGTGVTDDPVLLLFAAVELIAGAGFAVLAIVLAVWTVTGALRKPLELQTEVAPR